MFCTWTSGQSSRHTATSTSPPLTLTPTLSLLSPSSCTPFVYTPPPTPPTMTLFLSLRPPFHVAALTIAANYQAAPESQPLRPLVAPPPLISGVMTLSHRSLSSQPSTLRPRPLTRHPAGCNIVVVSVKVALTFPPSPLCR